MSIERHSLAPWLFTFALGAGAALFFYWIMAYGAGVTPDSAVYITAARSVVAGDGLLSGGNPLTHFPPGYPLALALAGLLAGGNVLSGARALHALLFGLNAALVVVAVQLGTRRSYGAALCAFALFVASTPVVIIHLMAWSEPLFIGLLLAAWIMLAAYAACPRVLLLVLGGLALGVAMATRWAGIAMLPAGVLLVLWQGDRTARRRVADALFFTVLAALPMVAALLRNWVLAGTTTNRALAYHPVGWEEVKALIGLLQSFVFPVEVSGWVRAAQLSAMLALLAAGLFVLYRLGAARPRSPGFGFAFVLLAVFSALFYVAFTLVSMSFFDALTVIEYRIFLPVLVLLIAAATIVAWMVADAWGKAAIWWGFVAFAALSISFNADGTWARLATAHADGFGFTARPWAGSQTLATIRSLPEAVALHSKGWDIIRFAVGRRAVDIPNHTVPVTGQPNPNYQQQVDELCARLEEGTAVLIFFNRVAQRAYQPTPEELVAACNAPVLAELNDGVIYGRADLLPPATP